MGCLVVKHDFSIIIPIRVSHTVFEVYLENLRHCLDSAVRQGKGEIIISDCGSISPYDKVIEDLAESRGCVYVRRDVRFWSRSVALNCGIQVALGSRIFIIDADTVLPENYVSTHLKKATNTNYTVSRVYDCASTAKKSSDVEQLYAQAGNPRNVGWSHISVDTAWLVNNSYNEEYKCWGGEDDDLNLRMELDGLKQCKIPLRPVHLYHLPYSELMLQVGKASYFLEHKQRNKNRYWKFRREVTRNGLWKPDN